MTTTIHRFIDKRTKISKISDRITQLSAPLDAGVFMHQYRDRTQEGFYSYKFELGPYSKKWSDALLRLLRPLYAEFPSIRKMRITVSQPYGWNQKMMSLRVWVDASDKVHTPVQPVVQLEITGVATPIKQKYFMGHVLRKNDKVSGKILTQASTFGGAVGRLINFGQAVDISWLKEIEEMDFIKLRRGGFVYI